VTRSGCAILLKNLPYETTEQDLRAMCERHGALARLVLPDTRALAIAEWLEPGDARKAFKGLAYKRYKHVPMYVEWAPRGIFSDDAPRRSATAGGSAPRADAGPGARAGPGGPPGEEEDAEEGEEGEDGDEEASRLFVKGLSFQTSDAALRAHFLRAAQTAGGRVLAATVATQKGPGGANLSRGFGFVEFDTPNAARAARRAMQGKPLEGRALSLELSSGGGGGGAGDRSANPNKSSSSSKVPPGMSATKIVVRNVAFEATRRDVQKLFNPFGTLKSCRLPKKFDGAHRGFAFVELATRRETSAALEALAGTHLYGRRLVIERAALEDDVETVREKTARRFAESAAVSSGAPTRKKPKTGKAY
jgi:multiple RNA-binding domain-containing protein 1